MAHSASAHGADDYPSPSQQATALYQFLVVKMPRVSVRMAEAVIQELAPTQGEAVKGLAKRLRPLLTTFGVRIKHAAALEAAARIQGHASWHKTPQDLRAAPPGADGALPSQFKTAEGVFAVGNPEVAEVLDRMTGLYERHVDVIGDDWERALQLRMEVQTTLEVNPRFLCSECMTPVYLVSKPEGKKLFFRHTLEDGRCSAVTRGLLSQDEINARKYNGVKESWLHQEMKRWVVDCLRVDGRFTDIVVEGRWTGEFTGAWRRPDVRAVFDGMRVAFEIQLSTTYINVIAQRREFYRQEGGLLFWVFSHFNLGARRLTQDDVFYNNNRNAFVVNSATREASVERGRFLLECVWAAPLPGDRTTALQRATVPFDELTLDQQSQRAYYFDFDRERAKLVREAAQRRELRRKALRERFDAFYADYVPEQVFEESDWQALRSSFKAEGVALPYFPDRMPKALLNALYSAKYGRVFGWDYPNFIQIAHHMEPGVRKHLHYFRKALKAYDRAELIRREDHSGKWAAKVAEYKARIRAGDPAYAPDMEHDALVGLLFPEVQAITLT
ncbi:MAG: hypothetical protein H6933_10875 [Burkholderiaceae bacterium]|nr:hypothetical protein [Burkholderiaceae bacterium]